MNKYIELIQNFKTIHPLEFWGLLIVIGVIIVFLIKKVRNRSQDSSKNDKTSRKQFTESNIASDNSKKEKENTYGKKKGHAKTEEPIQEYKSTKSITTSGTEPNNKNNSENETLDAEQKTSKSEEELQESDSEEDTLSNNFLYVGYLPPDSFDQKEPWKYPVVKFPKKRCIVRSYSLGRSKRRGYKEAYFQKILNKYFGTGFDVLGDVRLNTGENTRPYEPDIALIKKNSELNIRINIEIDEPYAGLTRQATHCIDKDQDDRRDQFFVNRGWIVLRFSELQIHLNENSCIAYIGKIINAIDNSFSLDQTIPNKTDIEFEEQWDIIQAQKWENDKYREKYLNHEFGHVEETSTPIVRELSEQEKKEEKQAIDSNVVSTDTKDEISYNLSNRHPRDKRIKFKPEPHIYEIDGVIADSVTTMISKFFPVFDPDSVINNMKNSKKWGPENKYYGMSDKEIKKMWDKKGNDALEKGSELHKQIENFYLKNTYKETDVFNQFKNFANDHNLKPYRSEWRIFDDDYQIAGTIDLIIKEGNKYKLFDWKRSKKVVNKFDGSPKIINKWESGIGQLCEIDHTSYNKYCLQQNIYKYILEENYGIEISEMNLVVFHPKYDNYHKVGVRKLEDEVNYILQTL